MLNWKFKDNVISELYYNGVDIINPWGFETADSSAFFSLEEGKGWRYKCIDKEITFDDKQFIARISSKMKEGKWNLNIKDSIIDNNQINRYVEAVCLEDSVFMDFVMRFRFKKEFIEYALIKNQKIYHNNTNVYYQHPVSNVFLKGKNFNIDIKIEDMKVPEEMQPVMYVRDNIGEWVVHVRMIPKYIHKEVIKICTKWAATRPLPQGITKVLLSSRKLKKYLWYRGEVSPHNSNLILKLFNPSAFPMTKVNKGTVLMWNVNMRIDEV